MLSKSASGFGEQEGHEKACKQLQKVTPRTQPPRQNDEQRGLGRKLIDMCNLCNTCASSLVHALCPGILGPRCSRLHSGAEAKQILGAPTPQHRIRRKSWACKLVEAHNPPCSRIKPILDLPCQLTANQETKLRSTRKTKLHTAFQQGTSLPPTHRPTSLASTQHSRPLLPLRP